MKRTFHMNISYTYICSNMKLLMTEFNNLRQVGVTLKEKSEHLQKEQMNRSWYTNCYLVT